MTDNAPSNILIVDDSEADLKLLQRSLEKLGYNSISTALSGETAFELCIRKRSEGNQLFDLIIADWNMPKMSGLDLLKKVRMNTYFNQIPFIMVTGNVDQEKVKEAISHKVDQFVVKPFQDEDLKSKIESAVEKRSKAS